IYIIFSRKFNESHSTTSLKSIIDFEKYINPFILMFLLSRTLALNELRIDSGERRHLNKLLIE
ncbi:hypothetical protein PIROE2DRAFT_29096, partial [Piromyces sp. E2]